MDVASLLSAAQPQVAEYAELGRALTDPAVIGDQARFRSASKRFAALGPVAAAVAEARRLAGDLETARELAREDDAFAAEVPALEAGLDEVATRLHRLLLPRDPDDERDVILEVKAGEGGAESALFAEDLTRMYTRYAERRGWAVQVLDATVSDLGGYKDVRLAVKARGTPGLGEAPWARLKYEGGVHRVQRVPVTESQGRIHTSAAGVLVMPEAETEREVDLAPSDLRIDVYRSSGPGGQSVNTTDSAVRITHLPTGIVVTSQNEKSQLQNKESAMRVLRARILQAQRDSAEAEASAVRRSQVRTVDRSERVRTYNFPENRITDHRTGYKAYNLNAVLEGELDPVVESAMDADEAARMAQASA